MSFKLFGTRVVLGTGALFLLAILGFWGYRPSLGSAALSIAAMFALGGFLSLLIHEFMHVAVARIFKIKCPQISVMLFGMGAHLESTGKKPKETLAISFAGPFTSFVLAIVFSFVAGFVTSASPLWVVFAMLVQLNMILTIFNILPLFPLDGGRVFHSLAWIVTRDRRKGLVAAVYVSRACILLGIAYLLASGATMFSLLWLGMIAFFLWQAGTAELRHSAE